MKWVLEKPESPVWVFDVNKPAGSCSFYFSLGILLAIFFFLPSPWAPLAIWVVVPYRSQTSLLYNFLSLCWSNAFLNGLLFVVVVNLLSTQPCFSLSPLRCAEIPEEIPISDHAYSQWLFPIQLHRQQFSHAHQKQIWVKPRVKVIFRMGGGKESQDIIWFFFLSRQPLWTVAVPMRSFVY